MNTMSWWRALVLMSLWCVAVGCGDDATPAQVQDAGGDARDLSDVRDSDALGEDIRDEDAHDTVSPGADTAEEGCEALPEIVIAGTPETAMLAADAAQCGQASFAWLSDLTPGAPGEGLGEVTKLGIKRNYSVDALKAAVNLLGASAPREIAHDVRVRIFEYTTQDRGKLVQASALVAFPTDHQAGDAPKDIIVLLHGTTGFTDACSATKELEYQGLAALIEIGRASCRERGWVAVGGGCVKKRM